MRIGLDTNVLVRFLTRDDEAQFRAADAFFGRLSNAGDEAFVNVVVLCELVWVLESAYGLERAAVVEVLRRLLDTAQLEIEDRELVAEAVEVFAKGRAGLPDFLIGVRNRAAGCDATVTFDRALVGGLGFRSL